MSSRAAGAAPESGRPGDKRRAPRKLKRVLVRYGTEDTRKTAFTRNVSRTGLFLQTNQVYPPGTTVLVRLEFENQVFEMWARVAWAKRVPPQLAHVLGAGMGLHFVDPPEAWAEFCRRELER